MLRRVGAQLLQGIARPASAGQLTFTRGLQFFDAPNGPAVSQTPIEEEWYNRQRNVMPVLDKVPWIQPDTWIAPNALVIGDVDIYDKVYMGMDTWKACILHGEHAGQPKFVCVSQ